MLFPGGRSARGGGAAVSPGDAAAQRAVTVALRAGAAVAGPVTGGLRVIPFSVVTSDRQDLFAVGKSR